MQSYLMNRGRVGQLCQKGEEGENFLTTALEAKAGGRAMWRGGMGGASEGEL